MLKVDESFVYARLIICSFNYLQNSVSGQFHELLSAVHYCSCLSKSVRYICRYLCARSSDGYTGAAQQWEDPLAGSFDMKELACFVVRPEIDIDCWLRTVTTTIYLMRLHSRRQNRLKVSTPSMKGTKTSDEKHREKRPTALLSLNDKVTDEGGV